VIGISHLSVSRGGDFIFNVEDALGDDHLELVDLGVAGVLVAIFVEAIKDLVAVEVDLEASLVGGGELDRNIAGVLGAPEFGRQPRGEAVVPSRHAVDDVDFNFAELGPGHCHG
jgi:hypothetical protein